MYKTIQEFNKAQTGEEREICNLLYTTITKFLPEAENKIWHRHPVWFLEGNPIVGYSKLKTGIRLMFWSGASFKEQKLKLGTGKFKDASIIYSSYNQINVADIKRWIEKSRQIHREQQKQGWQNILNNFKKHVESTK